MIEVGQYYKVGDGGYQRRYFPVGHGFMILREVDMGCGGWILFWFTGLHAGGVTRTDASWIKQWGVLVEVR